MKWLRFSAAAANGVAKMSHQKRLAPHHCLAPQTNCLHRLPFHQIGGGPAGITPQQQQQQLQQANGNICTTNLSAVQASAIAI
jgi:hypothetical protein